MHLPAAFTKTMHDRQCCASGRWYGRSGVELATAGVSMLAMAGSDPSADVEARQWYGQVAIGLNAGGDWGLAFFRVLKTKRRGFMIRIELP